MRVYMDIQGIHSQVFGAHIANQFAGAFEQISETKIDPIEQNKIDLGNAVELYFQALYECNLDKFDQVFHPSCSLFDSDGNTMTAMPIADYRAVIEKRVSPASQGRVRDDELISVDFLSDTAAVAKVRLNINGKVFVDHLSFAKVEGKFMIVAKVWHEIV